MPNLGVVKRQVGSCRVYEYPEVEKELNAYLLEG